MFCLVRSNLPMCTNSFTWGDWQFLKAIVQSPWIAFWKCGRMLFSVYVHHRLLAKGSLLVWKTREVWMALWWKFSHTALQVRNIKCALCSVINLLSSNNMSFVETITTNHNWSRAWITTTVMTSTLRPLTLSHSQIPTIVILYFHAQSMATHLFLLTVILDPWMTWCQPSRPVSPALGVLIN